MHVSIEVLALVAIAVLLLAGALLVQLRLERRLRSMLKDKDQPVHAFVVANPDAPEPPPHVHLWAKKPAGSKLGMNIYPCTVPGCRAEPLCHAGRR